MNYLLINDLHFGTRRVGGTTPESRKSLAQYLEAALNKLLDSYSGNQLIILGDAFDGFSVETADFLSLFTCLRRFMQDGGEIALVAGNHDYNPRGDKVSAFHLLHATLPGARLVDIDEVKELTSYGFPAVLVAHHSNQGAFEKGLQKALDMTTDGCYVMLHANYDNDFAAASDHSLNVSREWAEKFDEAGATLIFAHEHQARETGNVKVLGNQFPTSVSDCTGNDEKCAHILSDQGLERVRTWSASCPETGFTRLDWRDASTCEAKGFIRVEGRARAEEAGDVVQAIAGLRRRSSAFVITNAVEIEGVSSLEIIGVETAKAPRFDTWEFVKGHLSDEEVKEVERWT